MAALVNTEDVLIAATVGTVCVAASAVGCLWRDEIHARLLARRTGEPARKASPLGAAVAMLALGGIMLLAGGPQRAMPASILVIGALIVIVAHVLRKRDDGRLIPRPPTDERRRPSWVPPSTPDRTPDESPDDMRKTRPMPPV